jgi:hypothetical protein
MQTFKIDDTYLVVCEWQKRRGGFKHVAHLIENGYEVAATKCLYVNRTWERFPYASVLYKVISLWFKDNEKFVAALRAVGLQEGE